MHYPSKVLPESATYRKYGDQIAQCVAAAHKHGIEVHVWKVNYNLSGAPREFVERKRREGRTQITNQGAPHNWLCPSHPKNVALELDSMLEVARNYEIDGLHFDYIRYPNRSCCYCDGCRARFEASTGLKVGHWPADCYEGPLQKRYHDWRCEQITRLVAAVHVEAKKIRPAIKISAAVFGGYPACRQSVGQDWRLWGRVWLFRLHLPNGLHEQQQCVLSHWSRARSNSSAVASRFIRVSEATASRSGLSADRVAGQIHHTRSLGADGFTIFNLSRGTAEGILPGVALGADVPNQPFCHTRDWSKGMME